MPLIQSHRPTRRRVRRGLSVLVPVLCAALIVACAGPRPATMASAAAPTAMTTAPAYRLDAGDKLRVIVFGEMIWAVNTKSMGAGMCACRSSDSFAPAAWR